MLVMFDFISTVRDMTLHIRIQNFGSIRICFVLFNECGYTILHIQIKIKANIESCIYVFEHFNQETEI